MQPSSFLWFSRHSLYSFKSLLLWTIDIVTRHLSTCSLTSSLLEQFWWYFLVKMVAALQNAQLYKPLLQRWNQRRIPPKKERMERNKLINSWFKIDCWGFMANLVSYMSLVHMPCNVIVSNVVTPCRMLVRFFMKTKIFHFSFDWVSVLL